MSNIESIVRSLESKIIQILANTDRLKAENQQLKSDLEIQKKSHSNHVAELAAKQAELDALKIASSMLGSNEDKRESKLKINALIRDINGCIASLSD